MKGTVNPFEPWRPVEARIPPPLHVSRPWRPPSPPPVRVAVEEPPLVEPIKPLPRTKPPERRKQPQGRAATSAPRRTPIRQWAAFFFVLGVYSILVLVVLGVTCKTIFEIVDGLCGTHAPRVIVLGASIGLFLGLVFNRRRNWPTRLSWMTAALALAGIGLWFVPTTHGINLWSAYRQVEALRALPAGDVAAYQRGAATRQTLREEFPSFTADLSAAERAWFRRTVDEAIENADRQLNKDPNAALAHLHQLDGILSQLDDSMQKELASARRRAVQACVKVAQQP